MKGFIYIVALLLSAPNLIAGAASLVLKQKGKRGQISTPKVFAHHGG